MTSGSVSADFLAEAGAGAVLGEKENVINNNTGDIGSDDIRKEMQKIGIKFDKNDQIGYNYSPTEVVCGIKSIEEFNKEEKSCIKKYCTKFYIALGSVIFVILTIIITTILIKK